MSRLQRWMAFVIGTVFYAYVLLTRNLPVVVSQSLCQKFHMSEAVFGQYRGIYYLTYCLAHLPMAYLLDRFGPRWVMAISLFASVCGLAPMVFSDSAAVLIAGRMLLGLGSSAAILSVFKINRSFFEPRQFATLLGIAGTTGYISSVMGLGPLQRVFDMAGYNATMIGIMVAGIFISALSALCIKSVQGSDQSGIVDSFKQLIRNRAFWTVALVGGLMIWGTEGFADGWSVPLLLNLFKWNATAATDTTSLIFVGFAVGSIFIPLIANKLGNSKQLFGGAGIILAASLLALFIPEIPTWSVIGLYLIIGIASSYQILCIDWAGKVVAPALSTLASAAANMVIMSFGYLFHTIVALLMSGKGTTDTTCNLLRYTHMDLLIGLSPFIICALIAFAINHKATYNSHA